MDAEVFRPINIRATMAMHEIPERAVRHVLHRREGEKNFRAVQQRIKLFVNVQFAKCGSRSRGGANRFYDCGRGLRSIARLAIAPVQNVIVELIITYHCHEIFN